MLTERRYALPLQVLEPMELEAGVAALMLLNPTGGVVGGDRLCTEVRLGAGSHACLTTPSATRIYRSVGPPAVLSFRATLDAGARLEYVPDHLIPSPGARARQCTEVVLGPGATALILDAWSVGRPARGEAWDFAELDLGLACRMPMVPFSASGPVSGAAASGTAWVAPRVTPMSRPLPPWARPANGSAGLGIACAALAAQPTAVRRSCRARARSASARWAAAACSRG